VKKKKGFPPAGSQRRGQNYGTKGNHMVLKGKKRGPNRGKITPCEMIGNVKEAADG